MSILNPPVKRDKYGSVSAAAQKNLPSYVESAEEMGIVGSETTVMGSISTKIQCQLRALTIAPETVGPSAGPTEMTIEFRPMMAPRLCGGTSVSVVVISSGSTMAVPTAWMIRAMSSRAKLEAKTASTVPARKLASAKMNRLRVVKRWSRNPVVGITTETVSRNPVVSHWPAAAETCRSAMIEGKATVRTVSFRIMRNAARASAPMIPVSCFVFSAGAAFSPPGCAVVLLVLLVLKDSSVSSGLEPENSVTD